MSSGPPTANEIMHELFIMAFDKWSCWPPQSGKETTEREWETAAIGVETYTHIYREILTYMYAEICLSVGVRRFNSLRLGSLLSSHFHTRSQAQTDFVKIDRNHACSGRKKHLPDGGSRNVPLIGIHHPGGPSWAGRVFHLISFL